VVNFWEEEGNGHFRHITSHIIYHITLLPLDNYISTFQDAESVAHLLQPTTNTQQNEVIEWSCGLDRRAALGLLYDIWHKHVFVKRRFQPTQRTQSTQRKEHKERNEMTSLLDRPNTAANDDGVQCMPLAHYQAVADNAR